jgi:uncharacterized protein
VPLKVYDETIRVLKSAMHNAKLGRDDELAALQKLDFESRKLERAATGPAFGELIAEEFEKSSSYGGRSIFGREPLPAPAEEPRLAATRSK